MYAHRLERFTKLVYSTLFNYKFYQQSITACAHCDANLLAMVHLTKKIEPPTLASMSKSSPASSSPETFVFSQAQW